MSRADGLLRGRRLLTPLVAALVTGLLWSLASLLEDRPPWGGQDRVLGDLGNQSIPFLAYYRDVLTGHADGNLQFAWGMGYGQSFGPTFTMYLSNPLNVVVVLFPRLAMPTAIATVTILTAMAGAATMTLLLQRLRPGTPVLAIALGAAYATSQYAVNDASYQPMWLVGGAALPLMVYSALWVRERRRVAWLTPLLFFVCWYSNFYTSWMATLASGLIVCAMIVAQPSEWPRPWLTLARWAGLAVPRDRHGCLRPGADLRRRQALGDDQGRPVRPGRVARLGRAPAGRHRGNRVGPVARHRSPAWVRARHLRRAHDSGPPHHHVGRAPRPGGPLAAVARDLDRLARL
ncbi:YfhO family protein [Nostocoides sp. HKS02]|nr:YfhO family protein [Tetrasphaera sp. HKS02]